MGTSVGVLITGHVPEDLVPRYGDYGAMFASLMGAADPSIEATAIDVVGGEPLPADPAAFDGYIITGSRHGVYEDHPWIAPLEDFTRRAAAQTVPNVGICFGHQLMAQAFGGRVEKSDKGWGAGLNTYRMHGNLNVAGGTTDSVTVPAMHQDQVVEAAPDSDVIAGWDFCPFGGFRYPGGAISFQFHPEFAGDYLGDLIRARRGSVIPEDQADAGLASLDHPNDDRFRVAQWMARHLTGEGGA
jgi:GMP synthase-like glutamine amidotransferase